MSVTIVVSEFSYVYIETPIRKGALRRWFAQQRDADWSTRTIAAGVVGVVLVGSLAAFYTRVQRFDRAAGGADVAIDLAKVQLPLRRPRPPPSTTTRAGAVATPGVAVTADVDGRRRSPAWRRSSQPADRRAW